MSVCRLFRNFGCRQNEIGCHGFRLGCRLCYHYCFCCCCRPCFRFRLCLHEKLCLPCWRSCCALACSCLHIRVRPKICLMTCGRVRRGCHHRPHIRLNNCCYHRL